MAIAGHPQKLEGASRRGKCCNATLRRMRTRKRPRSRASALVRAAGPHLAPAARRRGPACELASVRAFRPLQLSARKPDL
jgi:hypothetical protein